MTTRIHVIGARNASLDEYRAAFSGDAAPDAATVNGWIVAKAHVWAADDCALDNGLAKLSGPSLRVTSEDGCRWYLRLFKRGLEPYACCHPFALMPRDHREDPPGARAIPSKAVRNRWLRVICPSGPNAARRRDAVLEPGAEQERVLAEMSGIAKVLFEQRVWFGSPVPRSVAEHLLTLPYRDAMGEFFSWQAGDIARALARFEIPHDGPTIVGALTGTSVTNGELASDLGNMPRFLAGLKFGPWFEDWVRDASAAS